ncbi:maleylpyruvate isomerase N-terminal domain-containing protein [Streptomyces griseofuscus]|uniref:maleylpyruvate isomerase N-terminal domain-containing protein n=1 Tax=Streptomyces griseofuscus TaxID=146922 RepID=UPI0033C018AF
MIPTEVAETLPELVPFARAVQARRPDDGTWCEAWTVRDVLIHQTGNAEELARVLGAVFKRHAHIRSDARVTAAW